MNTKIVPPAFERIHIDSELREYCPWIKIRTRPKRVSHKFLPFSWYTIFALCIGNALLFIKFFRLSRSHVSFFLFLRTKWIHDICSALHHLLPSLDKLYYIPFFQNWWGLFAKYFYDVCSSRKCSFSFISWKDSLFPLSKIVGIYLRNIWVFLLRCPISFFLFLRTKWIHDICSIHHLLQFLLLFSKLLELICKIFLWCLYFKKVFIITSFHLSSLFPLSKIYLQNIRVRFY